MTDTSLVFNLLARDQTGAGLNAAAGGFKGFMSKASKIAAVGVGGLTAAFSGFANDARESAKVGRLTEAVVKSTGGAAGVSADQVAALATAISNKTGADDEAIQSGQNLLLTFTNVKNSVGAGNDIFNQASAAAVDMAAALNGGEVTAAGLKGTSIQLGKALNDPIKGVTALTKSGVSFTQQQKDQIKAMVEAGDTAGAQKIILSELGKEFGGAAEAASDPMLRLQTTLGNTAESLGTIVLPLIDAFAKKLAVLAQWVGENETKVKVMLIVVGSLAATIWTVTAAMTAWKAIQTAVTAATKAWTTAQWLLNMAVSANPITLIIIGIVALIAIIVLVATKTKFFQTIWSAAWGAIKAVASAAWSAIKAVIGAGFRFISNLVTRWNLVALVIRNFDKIKSAAGAVKDFVTGKFGDLVGFVKGIPGKIGSAASGMFDGIKNAFRSAVNWIIGKWNGLGFTIGGGSFMGVDIPSASFGTPDIPYLAKGGNITRGGMAIVGEAGPEMVSLGRGAQVTPLTGRGAGGGAVRVVIDVTGADSEFKRLIQKMVRTDGGGSVQATFGRA